MRVSQAEKDRSHARIVHSGARLLREKGLEKTSVGDVMKAAGLTHGGFYRHFDDKDALVQAVIQAAFEQFTDPLETAMGAETPVAAARAFETLYLSDVHVENPGGGCPIAALSGEVARTPLSLKARFGAGVRRMIGVLARAESGAGADRESTATRRLAMMAGAVMIARASDPDTARRVLQACRTLDDAVAENPRP